jgi:hypothetical protein
MLSVPACLRALVSFPTGITSIAEPHHIYAAPAPGNNFDAAPSSFLLYSKLNI